MIQSVLCPAALFLLVFPSAIAAVWEDFRDREIDDVFFVMLILGLIPAAACYGIIPVALLGR